MKAVNRIHAMAVNIQPLFGVLLLRGVSPSKSDLVPPLERECNFVQKHVSFYILKRSPGCFEWAAPTLVYARTYLKIEENSLRGANTVEVSNLARIEA
jgi:hypothetical protein